MTPSSFQLPPLPLVALQSVIGGPAKVTIYLSDPSLFLKKPIHLESGDQKGYWAPSVPVSA